MAEPKTLHRPGSNLIKSNAFGILALYLYIMLKRFLALTFLTTIVNSFCFSQKDTVVLMNGNYVIEKVIDTLLGTVTVYHPTKGNKKLHYEYDDVYGIFYGNGTKHYFYRQDTARYMWFTREEMGFFVKGERDGRRGFKANGSLIASGLLGFVSGASGTFFAPVLPYGFMAINGATKIRIRHNTISNPAYIDSDAYILGYERTARYKRKLKALLGGTVGLAMGYAFYGLLHDQYPTGYSKGQFVYK